MPTFEIPDGPTTVELKRTGDAKNPGPATGSIQFTVKNTSTDVCAGRLSVVPSGNSKKEWFTIDGDAERNIPAGETTTAMIKISAPKDVAAGDYPFRLRAVAVNDPDNDHAEGPVSTAKVPPVPKDGGGGIPWWVWLIIGLVVLAALGVGAYFVFHKGGGDGNVESNNVVENNTTAPVETAAVPDFTANGMTVDQAKANSGGFDVVGVAGEAKGNKPGTILSQNPPPTTVLSKGSPVLVTYDPGVSVPQVSNKGLTVTQAANELANAHLSTGSVGNAVCASSGTSGEVVGQNPAAGQPAALNSAVQLSVRAVNGLLYGHRVNCFERVFELNKFSSIAGRATSPSMSARAGVAARKRNPGG